MASEMRNAAEADDQAVQHMQLSALLEAARHIFQPTLQGGALSAMLLGGHVSDSSALFVNCMCATCKPPNTRGTVFSLEEFCSHSGAAAGTHCPLRA
jgi:hypothetical protein